MIRKHKVNGKFLKNFRLSQVFDQTLVSRIYAETNTVEWYDMVCRLSDEELKKVCHYFHMEIILSCVEKTARYESLLSECIANLN